MSLTEVINNYYPYPFSRINDRAIQIFLNSHLDQELIKK